MNLHQRNVILINHHFIIESLLFQQYYDLKILSNLFKTNLFAVNEHNTIFLYNDLRT